MYEFDSVSVSAFEAAELAATLTAKSAEGWDVAGIVTAGSDVVAYLRRATGTESAKEDEATSYEAAEESQPVSTLSAESEPAAAEPVAASTSATDLLAGGATAAAPADSGSTGWGTSTDTSSSSASGWGTSDSSSSGSWGGSAQQATAPAAQTTPSVPAGWYADPAGRYELRYWDGGAWTEHVSRAGQQYTDPPVA
jgi:hypothetical protein